MSVFRRPPLLAQRRASRKRRFIPTAPVAGAQTITSPTLQLITALQTPTISGTGSVSITSPTLQMVLDVITPSIAGSGSAPITSPTLQLVLDLITPSINTTQLITAPSLQLVLDLITPTLSGTGSAPITSPSLEMVLDLITPTISGSGSTSITASVIELVLALQTPNISLEGVIPDFVQLPVPADSVLTPDKDTILWAFSNLLTQVGCSNVRRYPAPPITTWEIVDELFLNPLDFRESANNRHEVWFASEERLSHLNPQNETLYPQVHRLHAEGWAWHNSYRDSRLYIQRRGEEILRTMEKNKGLMLGYGAELTQSRVAFDFQRFGEYYLYKAVVQTVLTLWVHETAGRNV